MNKLHWMLFTPNMARFCARAGHREGDQACPGGSLAAVATSLILLALAGCGDTSGDSAGADQPAPITMVSPSTASTAFAPLPVIVQVMPLKMGADSLSASAPVSTPVYDDTLAEVNPVPTSEPRTVPVSVYGTDLDQLVALHFGPTEYRLEAPVLPNPPDLRRKWLFDVPATVILESQWVRVETTSGTLGERFYFKEVSARHPDLVRTNGNIVALQTAQPLIVLGHNFFVNNTILLMDGAPLSPSSYGVEDGVNGAFRLTLRGLQAGAHTLQLRNPPHDPEADYQSGRPYRPFDSNVLDVAVVNAARADTQVTNGFTGMTFDGLTGAARRLDDLTDNHGYTLVGQHPWRLVVRALRNPRSLNYLENPVLGGPYVNPINAGCYQNFTAQPGPESMRLTWTGCQLPTISGAANRFEVEQTFTLDPSRPEVRLSTVVRRDAQNPVQDYGLVEVKSYVSIQDGPAVNDVVWDTPDVGSVERFGTAAGRHIETYHSPGFTMPSMGGRDTCPGDPVLPELNCEAGATREGWMNHDGDGFGWYAASAPTSAHYDIDGHWLAVFPDDDALTPISTVHQGDLGEFRSTVGDIVEDNYHADSFDYGDPMEWAIAMGKGSKFTGSETWINIADRVREHYQSRGLLQTPLEQIAGIPGLHKKLTAHSVYGGDAEVTDELGQPRSPRQEFIDAFLRGMDQYGIEPDESFVFFWGGMVDSSQGKVRLRPNLAARPVATALTQRGAASCHYSVYSHLAYDDPLFPGIPAQEAVQIDPAGNIADFVLEGIRTLAMHARSEGQATWRADRFADMVGYDGEGPRCVYLDAVSIQAAYNPMYGSNGLNRQSVQDFVGFLQRYQQDMRTVHPGGFALHEAFVATSILHGGLTATGGMPTLISKPFIGVDVQDMVPAQYVMRIFGGYFAPLVNNVFTSLHFSELRYPPSEKYAKLAEWGILPGSYAVTPTEALEAENAMGAIYDGAAPFYSEMFNNERDGYHTLVEADEVPTVEWVREPSQLAAFAHMGRRTLPELVSLRRQCRGAFNGRWYPPVPIEADAPMYKDVYLFTDALHGRVHSARLPTLVNTVRQYSDGNGNWTDHIAVVLYNWGMPTNSLVEFQIDFDRYGLVPGKAYNLTAHTSLGSVALGEYSDSFRITLPVAQSRMGCLEIKPVEPAI